MRFDVIIPALDEEATIADVVRSAMEAGARRVVVVDNGSVDQTPKRAVEAGARVVREEIRGYGKHVLAAVDFEDPPGGRFVMEMMDDPQDRCYRQCRPS